MGKMDRVEREKVLLKMEMLFSQDNGKSKEEIRKELGITRPTLNAMEKELLASGKLTEASIALHNHQKSQLLHHVREKRNDKIRKLGKETEKILQPMEKRAEKEMKALKSRLKGAKSAIPKKQPAPKKSQPVKQQPPAPPKQTTAVQTTTSRTEQRSQTETIPDSDMIVYTGQSLVELPDGRQFPSREIEPVEVRVIPFLENEIDLRQILLNNITVLKLITDGIAARGTVGTADIDMITKAFDTQNKAIKTYVDTFSLIAQEAEHKLEADSLLEAMKEVLKDDTVIRDIIVTAKRINKQKRESLLSVIRKK